jgi:hypothetical protein
VYSYSRSRGIFAGIALNGSALTIDNESDARLYDRGSVDPAAIASGSVRSHDDIARRFLAAIDTATGTALPVSASAAPVTPPGYSADYSSDRAQTARSSAASPTAGGAQSGASGGATTFPMADPHPGAEPPR